mmetsp:Transcript_30498/g.76376  ORF Transcript_30498/g.76376 Transcript_30498/m.76376 type:complete len:249 (-) Transcript_30498:7-753(-)
MSVTASGAVTSRAGPLPGTAARTRGDARAYPGSRLPGDARAYPGLSRPWLRPLPPALPLSRAVRRGVRPLTLRSPPPAPGLLRYAKGLPRSARHVGLRIEEQPRHRRRMRGTLLASCTDIQPRRPHSHRMPVCAAALCPRASTDAQSPMRRRAGKGPPGASLACHAAAARGHLLWKPRTGNPGAASNPGRATRPARSASSRTPAAPGVGNSLRSARPPRPNRQGRAAVTARTRTEGTRAESGSATEDP